MKEEVVLIIIYNHRYDENIEILERLYKKRFSNIFHLMPFYNGEKSNVISVYENSHFFQGYIAQGFNQYFKKEFSHYLFIADDLILNPVITEKSYKEYFKLDGETSFITELVTLHEREDFWRRHKEAYDYTPNIIGIEVMNEIPTYEDALIQFNKLNLVIDSLRFDQIYPRIKLSLQTFKSTHRSKIFLAYIYSKFISWLKRKSYDMSYPLVGGYSDIAIVPAKSIKQFCHYCGVFSATNLFVELAIPTALVLSSEKIVTEKQLRLQGKALWTREEHKELKKFGKDLKILMSNFPENYIYLHPVKLSGWNTKI
jgi:hypothetical protein